MATAGEPDDARRGAEEVDELLTGVHGLTVPAPTDTAADHPED